MWGCLHLTIELVAGAYCMATDCQQAARGARVQQQQREQQYLHRRQEQQQ
jgi:hypothetical protein